MEELVRQAYERLPEAMRRFTLKVAPGGDRVPAELTVLTRHDVAEAQALNDRIARDVGDESLFVSDNTIDRNLNGEGWGLGVRVGRQLVAMAIVSTIAEDWIKLTAESPLKEIPPEEGAIRDIIVVLRQYRGNNLQRRLVKASIRCMPPGRHHMISTISPNNPASLTNALAAGCHVVDWNRFYGGKARFLTYIRTDGQGLQCDPLALIVPLGGLAKSHRMMLKNGYLGVQVEHWEHGAVLRYGKIRRHSEGSSS